MYTSAISSSVPHPYSGFLLEGKSEIQGTEDKVTYKITIQIERKCSATAEVISERRPYGSVFLELQFPVLNKQRMRGVLEKGKYTVKVHKRGSKELVVYLFSEKLLNDVKKFEAYLNRQVFFKSGKTSLIAFEADQCQGEELRQAFLLSIIKNSKYQIRQTPASINAMMILSRIGFPFNHQTLKGIKIRGAHLEETSFYGANLKEADLRDTRLEKVCLHQANLMRCQMDGIEVGRKPSLVHPAQVEEWSLSGDDCFLATCTTQGIAYIWNLSTYHIIHTIEETDDICSLVFGKDNNLFVAHRTGKVSIWAVNFNELQCLTHFSIDSFIANSMSLSADKSLLCIYNTPYKKKGYFKVFHIDYENKSVNELQISQDTQECRKNTVKFSSDLNLTICLLDRKNKLGVYSKKDQLFRVINLSLDDLKLGYKPDEFIYLMYIDISSDGLWLIGLCFDVQTRTRSIAKWSISQLLQLQNDETLKCVNSFSLTDSNKIMDFSVSTDDLLDYFKITSDRNHYVYCASDYTMYARNIQTHEIAYQFPLSKQGIVEFEVSNKGNFILTRGGEGGSDEAQKRVDIWEPEKDSYNRPNANKIVKDAYFIPHELVLTGFTGQRNSYALLFNPDPYAPYFNDDLRAIGKFQEFLAKRYDYKSLISSREFFQAEIKGACQLSANKNYGLLFMLPQMHALDPCFHLWNMQKGKIHLSFFCNPESLKIFQKKDINEDLSLSFRNVFYDVYEFSSSPFFTLSEELLMGIAIDKKVAIWDVSNRKSIVLKTSFDCLNSVRHILISKCSEKPQTLFFYCQNEKVIHKRVLLDGKKTVFEGHYYEIISCDCSYDNKWLVSTSKDGTLRLWDAETGKKRDKVKLHANLTHLKFSSDNRFITAFDPNDTVTYLWERREDKLYLMDRYPRQFGCQKADFTDVSGLSEANRAFFQQLGAQI